MGLLNLTNLEDGFTASANIFNERFGAIADVLNGNIDTANLAQYAVTREKLAPQSVTTDKLSLDSTVNANGSYIKMGNFLIQWGVTQVASTGTWVSFPTSFSSVPTVTATIKDPNNQTAWIQDVETGRFYCKQLWTPNTLPVQWIAIGTA